MCCTHQHTVQSAGVKIAGSKKNLSVKGLALPLISLSLPSLSSLFKNGLCKDMDELICDESEKIWVGVGARVEA